MKKKKIPAQEDDEEDKKRLVKIRGGQKCKLLKKGRNMKR